MTRLALVGLILGMLAACQNIPPEITVAGCSVAPALIPEYASEIATACAIQANSTTLVVVDAASE